MVEVKWYARGGQGGFTASRVLGLAVVRFANKYAQAFPSFGPERRGAPVYGFTRIDDKPIRDHSQIYTCDYAIVLDSSLMETMDVSKGIKPGGTLFIDSRGKPEDFSFPVKVVTYDALGTAQRILGAPISNTAMMTVFAAYTGMANEQAIVSAIRESMPERVVEKNIELIKCVFESVNNAQHAIA